jgi:ketosteroid isomerase-like protein
MPLSMPRLRPALYAVLALAVGVAAGWQLRGNGPIGAATAQEDANVLAETQLKRFYESLSGRAELADVLGDAFQVMRTDGTRYDRAVYLTRPPAYTGYNVADIKALQSGDTLTVSYFVGVTGQFEGKGIASSGEPRLVVFTRVGDEWKMQAIANLGLGLASDPSEQGKKAVDAWVGAVASGDEARVKAVVAPEFQIIRSDGTAYGAEAYVESELPTFPEPPQIANLVVTGYGDHLVARYEIVSKVNIGAETELRHGPRLTVFRKSGDGWLVVAHANLAAIVK